MKTDTELLAALGGTACEVRTRVAAEVDALVDLYGADGIPSWEVTERACDALGIDDPDTDRPRIAAFRRLAWEALNA